MRPSLKFVFIALLSLAQFAQAELDRVAAIDVGAGFPQLLAIEGQVIALPRWQVGLGYGLLPGSMTFTPHLKELDNFTTTLSNGTQIKLAPTIKTSLSSLTPFVRFFPSSNNFYMQLTYAMLTTKSDITSGLRDIDDNPIVGAVVTGHVELTQAAPTFSIGNMFTSHLFFINFALGATFLTKLSASNVSVTGALPDTIGDSSVASDAFDRIKSDLNTNLTKATASATKEFLFIPSIMISFGFLI